MRKPCPNGTGGWGVYPGVGGACVCVCIVKGEGREIKGLVPIILRASPVVGFL